MKDLKEAKERAVEKWHKDNGWVATERSVIPALAMFDAGVTAERERMLCACKKMALDGELSFEEWTELFPKEKEGGENE